MNILGNLGGLGKLLDPGGLVKDVVNGVLPQNMGAAGDAAGAFVDFKTGNPIGALQHAMEALRDLPQLVTGQLGGSTRGAGARGSAQSEPEPPAFRSRGGKPFDWNELLSAIRALTAALTAQKPPGAAASPAPNGTGPATTGTAPAANDAPAAPPPPASESPWRGRPTTAPPAGWQGQPATPPPATAAPATTPAPAAPPPAPTPAAPPATPPATAPAAAAPPAAPPPAPAGTAPPAPTAPPNGVGQTIASLDQLRTMSDQAVRDAVINGRISPEVARDQAAMMVIQQRMNAISEMNNLMTNMMRALHDMQMAVIQNIRI
jgi:hypothetical protein